MTNIKIEKLKIGNLIFSTCTLWSCRSTFPRRWTVRNIMANCTPMWPMYWPKKLHFLLVVLVLLQPVHLPVHLVLAPVACCWPILLLLPARAMELACGQLAILFHTMYRVLGQFVEEEWLKPVVHWLLRVDSVVQSWRRRTGAFVGKISLSRKECIGNQTYFFPFPILSLHEGIFYQISARWIKRWHGVTTWNMWARRHLLLTARYTRALCKVCFWCGRVVLLSWLCVFCSWCCCIVMAQVCTGLCLVLYFDGVAASIGNHGCLATTIGQELLLYRRHRKYFLFLILFAW